MPSRVRTVSAGDKHASSHGAMALKVDEAAVCKKLSHVSFFLPVPNGECTESAPNTDDNAICNDYQGYHATVRGNLTHSVTSLKLDDVKNDSMRRRSRSWTSRRCAATSSAASVPASTSLQPLSRYNASTSNGACVDVPASLPHVCLVSAAVDSSGEGVDDAADIAAGLL